MPFCINLQRHRTVLSSHGTTMCATVLRSHKSDRAEIIKIHSAGDLYWTYLTEVVRHVEKSGTKNT